jgi:catechol 2,3-dioxygenase-like lactoylglutathione lyase family enzyme
MSEWFARPVLFVADVGRSVDFYVNQLGFTRAWTYDEEGKALVAQVDRQGCALILSSQWPKKVGTALMLSRSIPMSCTRYVSSWKARAWR